MNDSSVLPSPWLCSVQVIETTQQGPQKCLAHVAVWAIDREAVTAILMEQLSLSRLRVLKIIAAMPEQEWIYHHGNDTNDGALARQVSYYKPVVFGDLTPVPADGSFGIDYLTITEQSIPSLPEQKGLAFWEKEWITPELKSLLFKQAFNTYLVVDANLRRDITKIFDLDILDVPVKCLFTGQAAEEMKEEAPYLVDMTLADEMLNNKEKTPEFHRDFFENHWHQGTGIVICTTASMDELHRHLRKFTQYKDENSKTFFFRFWETNCTYDYFTHIKTMSKRVKSFFYLRSHHWINNIISYNDKMGKLYSVMPNIEPLHSVNPESRFMLTKGDEQALMRSLLRSYAFEIQHSIIKKYVDELSHLSKAHIERTVFGSVERMHAYGIYDVAYLEALATCDIFLTVNFETIDKEGKLQRMLMSTLPEDEKYQQIIDRINYIKKTV